MFFKDWVVKYITFLCENLEISIRNDKVIVENQQKILDRLNEIEKSIKNRE